MNFKSDGIWSMVRYGQLLPMTKSKVSVMDAVLSMNKIS
jgi:hypothetical protein